jgi:hypothetical protein
MDKASNTVNRMRPIIEAMERSIDSARRDRLNNSDDSLPGTPIPTPDTTIVAADQPIIGAVQPAPERVDDDDLIHPAQRMKARPKRATGFGAEGPASTDAGYHSRAS